MDSNATYTYSMYNLIGSPSLLLIDSYPTKTMQLTDGTSYDYAQVTDGRFENKTIALTSTMRVNSNKKCLNASYPILGGNDNCTTYIGI